MTDLVYQPKALIAGSRIEKGMTGFYAAVPNRRYKDKPFTIKYKDLEVKVKDWNRAEKFRRFMDNWGRGAYTLGYFKMTDSI